MKDELKCERGKVNGKKNKEEKEANDFFIEDGIWKNVR